MACTVYSSWTGPLTSFLTLSPRPKVVLYGHTRTTLTGSLRSPLAPLGKTRILLQSKPTASTRWTTVATLTTTAAGTFSSVTTPTSNRDYRVSYAGAAKQYAASTTTTLLVRPRISLAAKRTGSGTKARITMSGKIDPASRGARVYFQRLVGTTWKTFTTRIVSRTGTYTVTFTAPKAKYLYRVKKQSIPTYTLGYSRWVRM